MPSTSSRRRLPAGPPSDQRGDSCRDFVDAYEDGWDPCDFHFWVFTTASVPERLGEWGVRAGWFYLLDQGTISKPDVPTEVLSTRQPAEVRSGDPPPESAPSTSSTR